MTESETPLYKLAEAIAKDISQKSLSLPFKQSQTLALEIHEDHTVVTVIINFGPKTEARVAAQTVSSDVTLKTSAETARAIKSGETSITKALTRGQIKVSGAVNEVISIANEISSKSR